MSRGRVLAHIAHGTETAVDHYRCPCAVCVEMNSIKRHRSNLRPARLRPDRQRACLHLTIHPRPQRLRAPTGQSGHHPERRPPRTPANPRQDPTDPPTPSTDAWKPYAERPQIPQPHPLPPALTAPQRRIPRKCTLNYEEPVHRLTSLRQIRAHWQDDEKGVPTRSLGKCGVASWKRRNRRRTRSSVTGFRGMYSCYEAHQSGYAGYDAGSALQSAGKAGMPY